MSLAVDPEFVSLPDNKALFRVWRIENRRPAPWADIGGFHTGDSYIVLSGVKTATKRIRRDIYYWIGSESTPDEFGPAALKSAELDDRFGGEPTQHRETQYHESPSFHALFKEYGGVRYLEGGVSSGPLVAADGTKLYQVKGRRNPVLLQVAPTASSLNHGDVFILTSPKRVILWIGRGANPQEKAKGIDFYDNIKFTFKGASRTRLDASATTPEFWAALGGEGPIASAAAGGGDEATEAANVTKIYWVQGQNFTLVSKKAVPVREMVSGAPILVIHRGETLVVYVTKAAPKDAKKNAFNIGLNFLKKQGLPLTYSISAVDEGTTCDSFDLIFA
jgi:hypothetical protein